MLTTNPPPPKIETFHVQFTDRLRDDGKFQPASQQINGFRKDNLDVELCSYKTCATIGPAGEHRVTIVGEFRRKNSV